MPAPVKVIYVLREAACAAGAGIEKVNAAEAAALLALNAYRPLLVEKMGLARSYFFAAANVLRHARVFYLTRPADLAATPEVVGRLKTHWRELGLEP